MQFFYRIFIKNFQNFPIFLRNFLKIFSKFPSNCIFRPNAQKGNAWFVNFLEKYAKIFIFHNFLNKFCENFLKISYSKIMHFRNFLTKIFWKFSKSAPPPDKIMATHMIQLCIIFKCNAKLSTIKMAICHNKTPNSS